MALETTATFIGHNECYGLSEDKLKEAIRELIENGVTDFLSGGQGGFDRMCGHCVYEQLSCYSLSVFQCLQQRAFRLDYISRWV